MCHVRSKADSRPRALHEPLKVVKPAGVCRANSLKVVKLAGVRCPSPLEWLLQLHPLVALATLQGFTIFFFFFTLVTGSRRSLSLKLSDIRVYEA